MSTLWSTRRALHDLTSSLTTLAAFSRIGVIAWSRVSREQRAGLTRFREALLQWLVTNWKRSGPPSISFTGNTVLIQFPPSPYQGNTGAENDG